MGNLSNLYISASFQSLLHLGNDSVISSSLVGVQDGFGNSVGIALNSAGDLSISGSFTSSLQQGYVWVGNSSGKTTTVPTSSFGGGGSATWPVSGTPSGIVSGSSQVVLQDTTYTDGVLDQFLSTDGAGNLSFDWVKTLHQNIRNVDSVTITRGTPLFVSGSTGDNTNVFVADAGNPLRRPATLIAYDTTLAPSATGTAIISGEIQGVDTNAYPAGTVVYLAAGGGWTSTRPTGSVSVQVLGVVTSQANNGRGIVFNQVADSLPNIQQGYTWVGDVNSVPQAVPTSSFAGGGSIVGYATTGSNTFTGSQYIDGGNKLYIQRSATGANQYLRLGPTDNENNFAFIVTGSDQNPGQQVWGINIGGGLWANSFDAGVAFNSYVSASNGIQIGRGTDDGAGRNALQISRLSGQTGLVINQTGVGASWFVGTRENNNGNLIISSSANDRYIEFASSSGWMEVYANQTNFNQGVALRGSTNVRNIQTDLGNGYVAQFDSISGSNANISGVMNLTPQNPLPSGKIGDLAVSGSSLYFYNGAWTLVI